MKVRVTAVAVALGCVVAASPSLAGPLGPPPGLVFSGSGPSTTTFTLREETRLDFGKARMTTRGSVGGVLILPVGRHGPQWGVLLHRTTPVGAPLLVLARGGNFTPTDGGMHSYPPLPAGTYRAYLLADAPVEVRLPVQQGWPQSVHATDRTGTPRIHVEDHVLPPGPDRRIELRHPFTRPAEGLDVLLAQFNPTHAEQPSFVLDVRRARPPQWGWTVRSGSSMSGTMTWHMGPDPLYAGERVAAVTLSSPLTAGATLKFVHFQADLRPVR